MQRSSLRLALVFFVAACSRPAPQQQSQAPAPPAGVLPGFKAVAGDLPNFATGGVTVLIGTKTN